MNLRPSGYEPEVLPECFNMSSSDMKRNLSTSATRAAIFDATGGEVRSVDLNALFVQSDIEWVLSFHFAFKMPTRSMQRGWFVASSRCRHQGRRRKPGKSMSAAQPSALAPEPENGSTTR